jgi:hypothetical protein
MIEFENKKVIDKTLEQNYKKIVDKRLEDNIYEKILEKQEKGNKTCCPNEVRRRSGGSTTLSRGFGSRFSPS